MRDPHRGKDSELVGRALEGDRSAFDVLVRRHQERVVFLARQITGDWEAAEEAAQEAFLDAYRCLRNLRDRQRFGPWLRTIARRAALTHLRRLESRDEEPMDPAQLGIRTFVSEPPPRDSEVAEKVREAVASLTQRNRRVVILHYLEGYQCREIAQQMGLTAGTVKRILFDSRTQMRKELGVMATAKGKGGPRPLEHWIHGSPGAGVGNVFARLSTLLAQTICLCVNKKAKSAEEIAAEVGAHAGYVAQVADDLLAEEILCAPQKGRYGTNFIALEGEDWRAVSAKAVDLAPRVAEAAEERLASLKKAYAQTPLASSWPWADVLWSMVATLFVNVGLSRNVPERLRPPRPLRPAGGRYWLGGREEAPGLPTLWCTGFNTYADHTGWRHGNFWTYGLSRRGYVLATGRRIDALAGLTGGPLSADALVERMGGDAEAARTAIADLIASGFIVKEEGRLSLGFPLFTQQESDLLTPVIDELVRPLIAEVFLPGAEGLEGLLDERGYGHLREQYPVWQRWLLGNMAGEAVRVLMEKGTLPRPPEPAPETFAFIAWKGDLPLLNWGGD